MFYEHDFYVPLRNKNIQSAPEKCAFNVLINTENNKSKTTPYSFVRSMLPLSYISSILAMKTFIFRNNTIKEITVIYRIYGLFVIFLFLLLTVFKNPIAWKQTATDLPLNLLSKTFTFLQTVELLYAVFAISFSNSKHYVHLYQIIDDIDNHFLCSKRVYIKRLIFAIFMMTVPPILVITVVVISSFDAKSILSYVTFSFVTLHGVNLIFHVIALYVQVLVFSVILKRKIRNMSPSKALTFQDDVFTKVFRKCLYDVENIPNDTHYSWFELMQIYDNLSDCVLLYNKIYDTQILIMLNSWLHTTILVLCRSLTPALKHSTAIRTDMYYYTFINLRPFFLTKISESLQHEQRKLLLCLIHALLYHEEDCAYHDQIRTMIELVKNKKLLLSSVVFPVNLRIMIAFAGRVISYAIMFIQNFYLTTDNLQTQSN